MTKYLPLVKRPFSGLILPSMVYFTPKNRLLTAVFASVAGVTVFLSPMIISKLSPGPTINSSKALKAEAIRRGAFNNSGSKDIGPEYVSNISVLPCHLPT